MDDNLSDLASAWHGVVADLQPNQRAWLRASEPIEPTRLQLQDADTGALILLDIAAEPPKDGEAELEPVRGERDEIARRLADAERTLASLKATADERERSFEEQKAGLIAAGRYVLRPLFRGIGNMGEREMFVFAALFTVIASAAPSPSRHSSE